MTEEILFQKVTKQILMNIHEKTNLTIICKRFKLNYPWASRQCRGLEEKGLVVRTKKKNEMLLVLTDKGEKVRNNILMIEHWMR